MERASTQRHERTAHPHPAHHRDGAPRWARRRRAPSRRRRDVLRPADQTSPTTLRPRGRIPGSGWRLQGRAAYGQVIEIFRLDVHDDAVCARAYEVIVASKGHERPWNEPPSLAETLVEWRHVDEAERMEIWGAHDGDELVGVATIWLPMDDNTTMAWFDVQVDPAHRGAARARPSSSASRARARRAGARPGRRLPRAAGLRGPRLPALRRAARLPPQQHRDHAPPPAARRRRAARPARRARASAGGRATIASRPTSTGCPGTCRIRSAR